ncbi:hypothetical protein O7623_22260 [Solwaraspora sp. WMMD791]|uniref:hypothetical protein n=1 Tax=Solwaraspora sp. WMMD791 TaxID=3016086 RepID=UPI00249BC712|nr:hypothetical protein [Solwaraspora sp. WMMD791]WFE26063.1 hypothetical protein O7623_22260 [Solwaraspora sp. WMMD791]
MARSSKGFQRSAILSGAALANLLLLSCGAGQIAETAEKEPSIQGVNLKTDSGEYKVRDLTIRFPGATGYRAGGNAPLSAVIYNDSKRSVTVTVTTEDARDIAIVSADQIPPVPEDTSAGASPSPQEPATEPEPVRILLPPLSFVRFNEQAGRYLQLRGLDESLRSGQNAFITFDFGNGQRITGPAPVAAPLVAVEPPPPIIRIENTESYGEGD